MATLRAMEVALELMRHPALATVLARQSLPADIIEVMEIAASAEAGRAAGIAWGISPRVLRRAARFYLQQVLFFPGAGPYRLLGLPAGAPVTEARLHLRWLMAWLHPDHQAGWDTVYAERVSSAWHTIRQGSGAKAPSRDGPTPGGSGGFARGRPAAAAGPRLPLIAVPVQNVPPRRSRRRVIWIGGAAAAAAIMSYLAVAPFGPARPLWTSLFGAPGPAVATTAPVRAMDLPPSIVPQKIVPASVKVPR